MERNVDKKTICSWKVLSKESEAYSNRNKIHLTHNYECVKCCAYCSKKNMRECKTKHISGLCTGRKECVLRRGNEEYMMFKLTGDVDSFIRTKEGGYDKP